jgi:hypothetical protein
MEISNFTTQDNKVKSFQVMCHENMELCPFQNLFLPSTSATGVIKG